jgi:hypothetical protein
MEAWPLSDRRNWDPAIVDRQVGVLVKPDTPIPKAMTDGCRKRPISVTYTHLSLRQDRATTAADYETLVTFSQYATASCWEKISGEEARNLGK